jgi:hypothetical protein
VELEFPVKLITVVVAVDVIAVLLMLTVLLLLASPAFAVSVNVTPEGTPLNVRRICEPLATAAPLLELCVAVLNAEEMPSVMTNDAFASGIFRFVKIVAVPLLLVALIERAPTAMLPIPGPILLITVTLVVVRM